MRITLSIGGYRILIEEPTDRPCFHWPHPRMDPFAWDGAGTPDMTIRIDLVRTLASVPKGKVLFDSGDRQWKLYAEGDGYLLESDHPSSGLPLMRARISHDLADVSVAFRSARRQSSTRKGWTPMELMNPLLEVVLLQRLAREGGALMHSSAVLVDDDAFVFFGPSGTGKSTIAQFFKKRGFAVLNDERVIVRLQDRTFKAFGTPWPGDSYLYSSAQGGLRQIFSIRQSATSHALAAIPARTMMTRLLQESYLPHWDPEGMARTAEFFEAVSERYGSLELSFCKSDDLVEFLNAEFQASVR